MKIEDVRREQLRKLVKKFGTQTALAEALDIEQNYISRTLKNKPIGEKFARSAEDKLGLPRLYFDTPDMGPDGDSGRLQNRINELPAEYRKDVEEKLGELMDVLARRPKSQPEPEPTPDDTGRWRLTRQKDAPRKRKKRK